MVVRRPLVLISGQETELPPGDTLLGASIGLLTASSGVKGGGDLSTNVNLEAQLAPNASGVILVDQKISLDGTALRTGQSALASGNQALSVDAQALSSGVIANTIANTAQASGNAALAGIAAIPNGVLRVYPTTSAVVSGYPVGLTAQGSIQAVGVAKNLNARTYGSGTAQGTITGDFYDSVNISGTNNVFIVHRGVSNYGYGMVATINNLGVSYGSSVAFNTVNTTYNSVAYNPASGQCLIAYRDNTNSSGVCVLANISGTSVNYGTPRNFATSTFYNKVTYIPTVDKYLVTYSDVATYYGYNIVATVSGSGLTYGTPSIFRSNYVQYTDATYDPSTNRAVVAYQDAAAGSYGSALVVEVSGTTPLVKSNTVYASVISYYNAITTDESESAQYIAFLDGTGTLNRVVKGKITSDTFVAGLPTTFDTSPVGITNLDIAYDKSAERAVVSYNLNSTFTKATAISSSGTVVYAGTPTTINSSNSTYITSVYNANQQRVLTTYKDGSTTYLTSIVSIPAFSYTPTVSGLVNYLGISQTNAASGSTATVRLPGSYDTNFSNLRTGSYYYLEPQSSGVTTSGLQPASFSGVVSWAPIGQALNSSTMLLTQYQ